MTTLDAPLVTPSPTRDTYRFGDGPDPVLRPGTMGWSIADLDDPDIYFQWAEGRFEIHDGVLVAMPASQFYGGAAAMSLSDLLKPYLRGLGLRPTFAPEADIEVLPDRVVRGDTVAIWGDDRQKFDALRFPPPRTHWSEHALTIPPTMVIESISVGHERHDRQTKRRWYADFGVRHYWIVDGLRHTLDCLLLDGGPIPRRRCRSGRGRGAAGVAGRAGRPARRRLGPLTPDGRVTAPFPLSQLSRPDGHERRHATSAGATRATPRTAEGALPHAGSTTWASGRSNHRT